MKYIDAEKLKRLVGELKGRAKRNRCDSWGIVPDALEEVEGFIDSLQQEQPEVDLKEEITSFFSKNPIPYEHITDWPLLKNTALHFYELGLLERDSRCRDCRASEVD